jgi:phosphoenolpyruvate carboxykinase (GTP)
MRTFMNIQNAYLSEWIESVKNLVRPDRVVLINGSDAENAALCEELIERGELARLNPTLYPNCYIAHSHPSDVARVEDRTYICSKSQDDAGPTNNWYDPDAMYAKLNEILEGSMKGRTMYVIPYLMGPSGSKYSRIGFEITDSAYVIINMRIMARIGKIALDNLPNDSNNFVRGIHTIGTLSPKDRYICHFSEDNTIISVNSNYGGNALQAKKCFALRMASILGRKEGWLAEHMLIVGITNPQGVKRYFAAAFPSGCGKTNLAMLIPPKSYLEKGWKLETVGDDIAWLNIGDDGRVYAINPEAGFFGIAPGTSEKTNPNALKTIKKNTLFTNTALNPENNTPWWDGLSEPPERLIDWLKNEWSNDMSTPAAHPNSRFTAPAAQCPSIDPAWENPEGVPISGIIFGGRRARTAPLVVEAFNWQHGTFLGVTMASETTAAAAGKVGVLRRDPMAMTPFIGYHCGDYMKHWLSFQQRKSRTGSAIKLPKIFHVNWFKTDENSKFLWPGFGENMRVLEWIFNRSDDSLKQDDGALTVHTQLGIQPTVHGINCEGLSLTEERVKELFEVNPKDWQQELQSQDEFFKKIGDKFPKELWDEYNQLKKRLNI